MPGFTKLWSETITSSIWSEDDRTRIVWITMLAAVGPDGIVRASTGGLAHMARVPRDACEKAIETFMSPDPDSRSPDNEGRRIQKVDGGYLILNYSKYREAMSHDHRAIYMKDYMRDYRRKQKGKDVNVNVNTPLSMLKVLGQAEAEADSTRESVFPSIKEASTFFEADFPDIKTNHSLSEMVQKKNWRLTESNCRRWLTIEKGHGKKHSNPDSRKEESPREQPISLEEQAELAKQFAFLKQQMNGQNEGY